ncbi:methyltransferase domain-containing protein [Bacteroides sp. 519]|nr:methyltransferase domain-containing protein [Bacteroides sp. 519]
MANSYFKFKQFTVWQDKCAMKVGTDGVLLGSWTDINHAKTILDVGTGTGLIALMLAQRSTANITAIEIDKDAYSQATENIKSSPWSNRIEVIHEDLNRFYPGKKYDLIVSNPPYFIDSLKSPDDSRTVARHNQNLTYRELVCKVSELLESNGLFSMIVPTSVINHIIAEAHDFNLHPMELTNVITAPGKLPKRSLISFQFSEKNYIPKELLIEIERHKYSDEFNNLIKDFYLNI